MKIHRTKLLARVITLIALQGLMLIQVPAQSIDPLRKESRTYMDASEARGRAVDFAHVSDLWLFLYKEEFREDDIFTLDIGLLTADSDYFFFKEYPEPNLIFKDEKGANINLEPVMIHDRFIKFVRLKNDFLNFSKRFMVGCKGKALSEYRKNFSEVDEDDPQDVLERNLLWSVPHYCIDLKETRTVRIQAVLRNELVVNDNEYPETRTATGSISSKTISVRFVFNTK